MKKIRIFLIFSTIVLVATACSYSEKSDSEGGDISGQGGSLARFTIAGEYLYTVDQSSLHTISITDVEHPLKVADKSLGVYTETIFPYENSLLLGTETGMFVFDLSNPSNPQQTTYFQHIRSCDPVVAENGYAYITLNTANQRCFNGMNELQIVNISNLNSPILVKTYNLASPLGLDIHNDTLYVCGYFHDHQQGQLTNYTIYRPDNSVFSTWTHSPNQTYAASYWYWYYIIPSSPMLGTWRFQVQLQGQTCEHAFEVIDPFIAAGINETSQPKIIISPNPVSHFLTIQNTILPIELYSMFGQKVGIYNTNSPIDISNIPNGIYLLKSGVQYQKLVIQH